VTGDVKFVALSVDTESYDKITVNTWTAGDLYDWGFSLLPRNGLTSQVLIGLGWACTSNIRGCTSMEYCRDAFSCGDLTLVSPRFRMTAFADRSPIWLT
jgi:hypothetical protein